jgi:cytochrome c
MMLALTAIAAMSLASVPANAAGDAARGDELYNSRCIACHSLDANRVGPAHRGVFGRKAGAVADFDYSPAVRNAGIVWNEDTLGKWLTDPGALIPGNKMGFRVNTPKDRDDIIAFLKRQSGK